MKFEPFEDLPVWKDSIVLAAAISNNIAEGFERGTTQELISFLYYARGSAGEVRSILWVMERIETFIDLKSEIFNLRSIAETISRQIRGWAAALQNTPIQGQRYLNDRIKSTFDQEKSRKEFNEALKQYYQPHV